MLVGVRLTVNFTREQNCFAYINNIYKYSSTAGENECVKVQLGDKCVYLWVVFSSSVPEGSILLNPQVCTVLELDVKSAVIVSTFNNFRRLKSLEIEADTTVDQIILEHNQIELQSIILEQIRLLVANQKAVVWISPSISIVITPHQTGILVNHSQLIVKQIILTPQGPMPLESIKPNPEKDIDFLGLHRMAGLLHPVYHSPRRMALRALPIDSDGKRDSLHPYVVFIHEDLIEENFRHSPFVLALMKSIPMEIEEDGSEAFTWRHELCIEVVPVDSVVYRSLSREVYSDFVPTIIIPKSLNTMINVESGYMVMLTFIDHNTLKEPQHIEITTYEKSNVHESEYSLIEKFKNLVVQNTYSGKVFLVNNDMVKENHLLTSGYIKIKMQPIGLIYTILTKETFRNCTISANILNQSDMKIRYPLSLSCNYEFRNFCRTIKPFEMILEKIISYVYFDIQREARYYRMSETKSSVLITGLSGTGKSTLCHLVEKEVPVYSFVLSCRALRGRKDAGARVARALAACAARRPALLMLDDVDDLVPASQEGLSQGDINSYKVLAVEIKRALLSTAGVSVVLTARCLSTLHPVFRLAHAPLYTCQCVIPELAQEDRVQLLQHLVSPSIRDALEVNVDDVIRLSMETQGHTIKQIVNHYKEKVFAAIKKKTSNPILPNPRLVEDVSKDPGKDFDVWGPIGGLQDVKKKLNECLFWPILYPALFPSQSCGILLYGPPGTGKSLIGSCLARMHNMRMLIVKGPELLSKYIGQSEAAVREVFDKAELYHPCIIFFDEFDSLAPKRGHDSTGVTDRVVNQLLARLDGAEGRARGPVLAATSRPDLVDPALLRPGRIATHIYTELPGVKDRHDILRTLAKEFHVSPSVALGALAAQTEGFSPADLRALLVSAQLNRVDLQLLERGTGAERPSVESLAIDTDDLDCALFTAKPSLNKQQRLYYDTIYRRFRGESAPQDEMQRLSERMRVTLA